MKFFSQNELKEFYVDFSYYYLKKINSFIRLSIGISQNQYCAIVAKECKGNNLIFCLNTKEKSDF